MPAFWLTDVSGTVTNTSTVANTTTATNANTAASANTVTNTLQALTDSSFEIRESVLIDLLVKTLEAVIIAVILLILARIFKNIVFRLSSRASRNPNLSTLLSNLTYTGILVLLVIWVLTIYTGAGLSSLITLLGIISVAISLSVQDVLKNFVAGIFLLLEQPFSIGDRIQVRDIQGKVETIEIRTTKLITDEGMLIIIPNGIVFTEIVTNRTASDHTLVTIELSLKKGQSLTEVSQKIKGLLEPFMPSEISPKYPPAVRVQSVTEGATKATLEFWTVRDAPRTVKSEVAAVVRKALPDIDLSTDSSAT